MVSRMHSAAPARDPAILIVDDAPAILDVLRRFMLQQGYQTFVATSGERALSIARRVHPDLILLDVMMPGMDGLETCRQLKLDTKTQDIPVIFMSAANETDDVVAGFEHGAVDYIGKPLRMAEVIARVRTQLQIHTQTETQLGQVQRLRLIVDTMAEGLLVIDATGRIQYTNPACDSFLGYAAGDLSGHMIAELLPAGLAQEYYDYLRECVADPVHTRAHGTREVAIRHRDGASLPMDLTLTRMQAEGEPLFVGLLHDISHRKQYEDSLERRGAGRSFDTDRQPPSL
jgi:two-component system, cell cycle response regulator